MARDPVALRTLIEELFPFPRSITGDGVRDTLRVVQREIGIEIHEVASGTEVLDWTVPLEWNVREAWIASMSGERIVDFAESNLHVLGYSEPIRRRVTGRELRDHLYTLPDQPDRVPYRTSYYERRWGFCVRHDVASSLGDDDEYEVLIDASLEPGSLTYGELFVPGESEETFLVSTHVCHPSLANDNLSGIAVAVELARHVLTAPRRLSYRFLFVPGTIGSITWLARNSSAVATIGQGLVLTGLGDPGPLTYKRSRQGTTEIDRTVAHVLASSPHRIEDFSPYGYDERQYCSPGFDLAVGRLSRTPHGTYPEYHTSGDNLSFVTDESLAGSLATLIEIVTAVEAAGVYRNLVPYGEPQLGRRGLYRSIGAAMDSSSMEMAFLWVLNLSDGQHSVLDIAERSGLRFAVLEEAIGALVTAGLLAPV